MYSAEKVLESHTVVAALTGVTQQNYFIAYMVFNMSRLVL